MHDRNRLSDDNVTCFSLKRFKSLLTNLDYPRRDKANIGICEVSTQKQKLLTCVSCVSVIFFDIIEALKTISRYLDGILNINTIYIYFDNMERKIYPGELQLNKSNCL